MSLESQNPRRMLDRDAEFKKIEAMKEKLTEAFDNAVLSSDTWEARKAGAHAAVAYAELVKAQVALDR